jgi:hypothetical protein
VKRVAPVRVRCQTARPLFRARHVWTRTLRAPHVVVQPSSSFRNASSRRCRGNRSRCTLRRSSQKLAATDVTPTKHADDQDPLIAWTLLVDPQGAEDHGRRPDDRQQRRDQHVPPPESRRLVVELRDMPAELISKRLAKALLAQRLRLVAHIPRAPPEQSGRHTDDRNGVIPTGQHIVIVRVDHDEEDKHRESDEKRAREVAVGDGLSGGQGTASVAGRVSGPSPHIPAANIPRPNQLRVHW